MFIKPLLGNDVVIALIFYVFPVVKYVLCVLCPDLREGSYLLHPVDILVTFISFFCFFLSH